MNRVISLLLVLASVPLLSGCPSGAGTTTNVRQGSGQNIQAAQAESYNGPKARIAVARFENKTADSYNWFSPSIGDGMADMLTTAMVNSGRYIVLERENLDTVLNEQDLGASGRIKQGTEAQIGEIEGAELLIVAAVTEFDDNSGGTRGAVGGFAGGVLGAIAGGSKSAHMAIDLRVVDATTSRILAATSVEGEAKDFNVGGALGGYFGGGALGGGLQSWKNTPREKALRQVINEAVKYVISVTPAEYMRYGGSSSAPAAAAASSSVSGSGERVVITASSLNVRSGPGSDNPAQFSLTSGTIVDVLARAGDWIQVRDGQGRTGWVAGAYTVAVQ